MRGKPRIAKIADVTFFEWCGQERASGICVEHPNVGVNGIRVGEPIYTSQVVRKFKNGNFITRSGNRYIVVPRPAEIT